MNTDIKKLQARIADRQERAEQETERRSLDMARMYEKDVKDLTDVLNFINAGDYESAWSIIDWLDTVVREEIPVRLYNFIAREIGAC
jgi:hypothetical protein